MFFFPLSDEVLSGKFQPGQTVIVDVDPDTESQSLLIRHEVEPVTTTS